MIILQKIAKTLENALQIILVLQIISHVVFNWNISGDIKIV